MSYPFISTKMDFFGKAHDPTIPLKPQTSTVSYRTLFVICVIAISQGLSTLADLAVAYLYKDEFSMNPAAVSIANSIVSIPFMIKPVWGFTTDCFPIFGMRRLPYLLIFSSLGVLSWLYLSTVHSAAAAVGVLLFNTICSAFCNVIGQALVVEESQKLGGDQDKASKYVSIYCGVCSIGIIITAYLSGALLEVVSPRIIFCVTAAFPGIVLICSVFLKEELVSSDSDTLKVKYQMKESWKFLSQKEVFVPIIFIFCYMATPYCGDVMFFYYTNKLGYSPEFMGRLKMVQGLASLFGIIVYNQWLKNYDFKSIVIYTTVINAFVSSSQLLLLNKTNLALGIPNLYFCTVIGFLQAALSELNKMPMFVLCARICPKNIEGTMYAFFKSVMNFGNLISLQLGSLLMFLLGIDQIHFTMLWLLIVIANMAALLPLPLLIWLRIPKSTYEAV